MYNIQLNRDNIKHQVAHGKKEKKLFSIFPKKGKAFADPFYHFLWLWSRPSSKDLSVYFINTLYSVYRIDCLRVSSMTVILGSTAFCEFDIALCGIIALSLERITQILFLRNVFPFVRRDLLRKCNIICIILIRRKKKSCFWIACSESAFGLILESVCHI